MYEEDRLRALELYSRMFDEATDERALLQTLMSPTRQAVVVARAYNSNLGKLSINTEHKAEPEDLDENGVPDYVQAIERIRDEALAAQPRAAAPAAEDEKAEDEIVDENQMTLFAGEELAQESAEPEENEPEEIEQKPAEDRAEESDETAEENAEEIVPEEEIVESESGELKESIAFFELPPEGETDIPANEDGGDDLSVTPFNIETGELRSRPRREPKVFALIVYILFAIPLTIAAILILLIPALFFLALSVAAIICGVVVVSAAFNGFAVFADIMVLLGGALILFALGLLFLWTSIWFVGGAIVGVVHGVAALCDKWCYKEVRD